ncbi:MAG: hypothetical protein IT328_06000 [Caldilineaceae bacterium]|nr:hypothetical protein [Caldilineaceae bacterium]
MKRPLTNPLSMPLPSDLTVAPIWALTYVGRMMSVCHHKRPISVLMASDAWFDSVGKSVDGCFFNVTNQEYDLIIIRESATPTEDWYDVLAHEFAHALHGEIDQYISKRLGEDATHRELVEQFIPLLGGLVQVALGRGEAACT